MSKDLQDALQDHHENESLESQSSRLPGRYEAVNAYELALDNSLAARDALSNRLYGGFYQPMLRVAVFIS